MATLESTVTAVAASVILLIGIWVVMLVYQSVNLPTYVASYTNETINFAVNNSWYPIVNDANDPGELGQPISITFFGNQTAVIQDKGGLAGGYQFNATNNSLRLVTNASIALGNYNVSYTYYTQQAQANTTLGNATTTTFNAMSLLAVGLIVLSAAVILAYFGFGRKV